jgi:hypothetical protein
MRGLRAVAMRKAFGEVLSLILTFSQGEKERQCVQEMPAFARMTQHYM